VPRRLIDPGPFRFTEIHGPHRSSSEQGHAAGLIRKLGLTPARCEFALEEIPLIDLIESLLLEAHDLGYAGNTFQYEAWRAEGAPEAALRAEFAATHDAARERRPQDTPLLDNLAALYAHGDDEVEPLVAVPRDRVLSSGEKALIVVDGRHRTFAATDAGVERLPVFVLRRADATFSY
jgi:hypothetical protein